MSLIWHESSSAQTIVDAEQIFTERTTEYFPLQSLHSNLCGLYDRPYQRRKCLNINWKLDGQCDLRLRGHRRPGFSQNTQTPIVFIIGSIT